MESKEHSRIISVSIGKGCYRHLRIPSYYTLEDLACAILDAFDFDNDHGHAFFMNNRSWDDTDSYYIDFDDGEAESMPTRYTNKYTLKILHLKQKFKFVFDFGDNWEFQCQYLRDEPDCEEREIIRKVGEPPEQYPDYEDDEENDSEKENQEDSE